MRTRATCWRKRRKNQDSCRLELMPTPKNIIAIKASESVVSRMLAKALGVAPAETVAEVSAYYIDENPHTTFADLLRGLTGLYAWTADVTSGVMQGSTSPLTEHLMSHPSSVFLVKDNVRTGADSLWLAVADPSKEVWVALQRNVCRGIFRTFTVGGEHSTVVAIQLSSVNINH